MLAMKKKRTTIEEATAAISIVTSIVLETLIREVKMNDEDDLVPALLCNIVGQEGGPVGYHSFPSSELKGPFFIVLTRMA